MVTRQAGVGVPETDEKLKQSFGVVSDRTA